MQLEHEPFMSRIFVGGAQLEYVFDCWGFIFILGKEGS